MLQIILSWAPNTLFGYVMFHNVFEKFSRSFVIFLVFFVAQIVILDFLELFLAMILNNSENKKIQS
jgi:hypothetical protein